MVRLFVMLLLVMLLVVLFAESVMRLFVVLLLIMVRLLMMRLLVVLLVTRVAKIHIHFEFIKYVLLAVEPAIQKRTESCKHQKQATS